MLAAVFIVGCWLCCLLIVCYLFWFDLGFGFGFWNRCLFGFDHCLFVLRCDYFCGFSAWVGLLW